MSEPKLDTSLLDGFTMGAPMSSHDGVVCYPAIKENTESKYIIKKISIPASQVQLDALLLTGAYKDPADATDYFRELSDTVVKEAQFLQRLGKLDGFLPYESWQVVPMEKGKLGYEVHLAGTYKRSLEKYMRRNPVTHLEAVNLGLDLCQALAICRRAGCLYVDLKPSNIFISKGKEYRIGDLGFVELDSLKYSSLPAKYRSPYSPPEVQNDLNTLNETVDTYAVGMILYQIYNDGKLPAAPKEPSESFPAPANADYEISEIIMKAIAPEPKDRWKDPMEMGQALVAYMQRNTVNNTPITPPPAILPEKEELAPVADETLPSEADAVGVEVPEELSGMFAQADKVLTQEEPVSKHEEISESVQASEPEEVPQPEVSPEPEAATEPPVQSVTEIDEDDEFAFLFEGESAILEETEEEAEELTEEPPIRERKTKKSNHGWITAVLLVIIAALLGACCFFYYQNIYLRTINGITVDGSQNQLTVTLDTDAEDALLTIICTDTYGNATRKTPVNGQAEFTDLLPNSQYRIQLEISGFHKLVGTTTYVFNTEAQTTIVSLSGITGTEDGSVVLNFTVDGSEPDEWSISYSAEGEEELTQTFTGHNVTVRGLTVGKVYTFRLDSSDNHALLGQTELEFTASRLILAEELTVVSCENGNMTVRWNTPENAAVDSWFVRCYADSGYEQQMDIESATEVVFTDVDSSKSYTVEVYAKGMTQPARVSVSANPITITGMTINEEDPEALTVSWDYEGEAPVGGWLLMYSMDGSNTQYVVKCDETTGVVSPRIHGAKYKFVIQTVDGSSVFNSIQNYTCPNAEIFEDHALSAEKITAHLLKTPEQENWSYKDISNADYTNQFAVGEKISLVLYASVDFYIPEDEINVMYVIRDGESNVMSELISQETLDWYSMWVNDDYHFCELDVPNIPTQPGNYSLSLYFNGKAIMVITFSITE